MAEASKGLHEQNSSAGVIDRHRALASLMEELEAVDWYAQRAEATSDEELRAILQHNGDEEKEHAAMVLEWLRRNDARLAQHLETYLFLQGSITGVEEDAKDSTSSAKDLPPDGSLGIGSLKGKKPWTI